MHGGLYCFTWEKTYGQLIEINRNWEQTSELFLYE